MSVNSAETRQTQHHPDRILDLILKILRRGKTEVNAVPGGSVELEREDDVIGVADLTDEAALRAQVALEHVVGGEL